MIDALVWLQGLSGFLKFLVSGVAVLLCVGFLMLLWQAPPTKSATAETRNPPAAGPTINQSVTSHGQTGGITAHTVNSDAARK
jgi:hypothetical protein